MDIDMGMRMGRGGEGDRRLGGSGPYTLRGVGGSMAGVALDLTMRWPSCVAVRRRMRGLANGLASGLARGLARRLASVFDRPAGAIAPPKFAPPLLCDLGGCIASVFWKVWAYC